jgi:hypothetical protein
MGHKKHIKWYQYTPKIASCGGSFQLVLLLDNSFLVDTVNADCYLHVLIEQFHPFLQGTCQFEGQFFNRIGLNFIQKIKCWIFSLSRISFGFRLVSDMAGWSWLASILSRSIREISYGVGAFLKIFTVKIHIQSRYKEISAAVIGINKYITNGVIQNILKLILTINGAYIYKEFHLNFTFPRLTCSVTTNTMTFIMYFVKQIQWEWSIFSWQPLCKLQHLSKSWVVITALKN